MEDKYLLTLDVGTTTIRAFIYNKKAEIVARTHDQVILHYPSPGYVEIDPDELWTSIVNVVHRCISDSNISASQVTAMGISTQRSTFVTWSRKSGQTFHKLITWKDLRADKLVKSWNSSYTWRLMKAGAYVLFLLSRSKRYKSGSVLKFMNTQTTLRFHWALKNVTALKTAVDNEDAMFGTLDTWLLYKLTDGKVHVSDASSASATGFYDPFTMQWADWALGLFKIPPICLPKVVDTVGEHFGCTSPTIWGHSIPIASCMADQTASMWGSCCFEVGDVKLTMGTGTFFNMNTGSVPMPCVSGLYPVVAWKINDEVVYSAEGANNDTASIIKWAQSLGLFDDPENTADVARSVPDSDGVYFVPAFSGLGPPYNDGSAASGFVGLKPSTTKAHLVRAVLESLVFRTYLLYKCFCAETNHTFHTIRLDGGVSNNDFIAQLLADLTELEVERPVNVEMSSFGCAYIVGLHLGIWRSKEQLMSMRKVGNTFKPRPHVKKQYEAAIQRWQDAAQRLCGWYSDKKQHRSGTVSDSSQCEPRNSFMQKVDHGDK